MCRELKDSGIPWIGEIPKEWNVKKLKFSCKLFGRIGFRGYTADDLVEESEGAITLSPTNMNNFNLDYSKCSYLSWDKYYESPEIMVEVGDVLLVKTASVGKCSYVDYLPKETTVNPQILVLKEHKDCSKFVAYLFHTSIGEAYIDTTKGGSTIYTISQEKIGNFEFAFPPFTEQQRIAEFLDRKCAEVDEMIALQEQIIEELKAYKQSVITEAVTKGLNPAAPMRDSEIVFVDKIPSHWKETKTLRLLSMPITDGPHETPDGLDDGIPFISADAVSDGYINFDNKWGYISQKYYEECCKKYIPQKYDIYMIKSGASTGRTAIVETDEIFTIWSPLAVFRANTNIILPYFLLYVLRSDYYQKQVENKWSFGTQQNIGMRVLEKLLISYPPITEQQAIADYLDDKCADIDSLIQTKQSKIDSLKEYKKSIIYEYVTGKREVNE